MQAAKETAANTAAAAKAGMEKTKAIMEEKGEKMTNRDQLLKEMAAEKKDERVLEAERQKQETRQHNAATKQAASIGGLATGPGYTTGRKFSTGQPTAGTTAEGVTPGGLGSEYPAGATGAGGLGSRGPTTGTGGRTGYGTS